MGYDTGKYEVLWEQNRYSPTLFADNGNSIDEKY